MSDAADPVEGGDGDEVVSMVTGPEANSSSSNQPPSATASPSKARTKVDILLKATGNAPIMTKRKWAVEKVKTIGSISEFVKKYIKIDAQESLFLYVNQSFAPSPDVEVGTLYDCFGAEGKLVLHYCKTQAWG